MEQVAKLKRTWNLAPVLQIIQTISKKYCPCSVSVDQVWLVNELWFKRYIQKYTIWCTTNINTHHDVTYLVNQWMVKNKKTWISQGRNITFWWNKKILNLCLRWHILRSYCFVAEVTFKIKELNFLKKTVVVQNSFFKAIFSFSIQHI